MTVKELIRVLQHIEAEHGDKSCYSLDEDYRGIIGVYVTSVNPEPYPKSIVILQPARYGGIK